MTAQELTAIIARVGGHDGRSLATMHGVGYRIATGWINGDRPIPEPVAAWWSQVDAWVGEHPPPRAW